MPYWKRKQIVAETDVSSFKSAGGRFRLRVWDVNGYQLRFAKYKSECVQSSAKRAITLHASAESLSMTEFDSSFCGFLSVSRCSKYPF
ncbi:hypothetical protein RRG08_040200 [Elysia crispata]|uniref:Uncharacterized protein n=1 Tax=Elysia crispata TaxID=231223 RepID=A0AAE1CPA2_9GAST|nr:hypothetical protein RRG08_040200 [Elysia crispata]